jgi:phosphoglycerate dehydrogenase-like enzyme
MTRVLVYEKTFQRAQERLARFAGVDWIVFDDACGLSLLGRPIAADEARLDAGWFSVDLYLSPVRRDFNRVLLRDAGVRWVQLSGAGIDDPEFADLFARGVDVATHHGHAVIIADFVLAGVLDHFQRGPERRAIQAAREWRFAVVREMADSRWLILGFGAIGQGVAERARAFGAKITAVRRSATQHPLAERTARIEELPDLLPHADVVVLCLPQNEATAGLADARFLAAMPERSVLVNVGRGGLVNEADLLAALDGGKPEHAILDVFQTEPLPKDSRFWSHPRVALTCHAASISDRLYARADDSFFDNLERFRAGQEVLHKAVADDFRTLAGADAEAT